jgi:uncharacterized protein (DUF1330 family)
MHQNIRSLALVGLVALGAAGMTPLRAATITPKAYKSYVAAVAPVIAHFGETYLVRGGQTISIEGAPPSGRVVVIEFDSLAAARTFEDSADYAAVSPIRHKAAQSRVFLVEGAPQ